MKNLKNFLANLLAEPIETICVHGFCHDGTASATILYQVFPKAKFHFFTHGSPEFDNFQPTNRTLFCDLAPPATIANNPLVFAADHHIGVKDLLLSMGDRALFADEVEDVGVSGASLAYLIMEAAYQEDSLFHRQFKLANFKKLADLIAIRDTWQTDSPDWEVAMFTSTIISSFPAERFLREISTTFTDFEKEVGEIFYQKRLEGIERAAQNIYTTTLVNGKSLLITDHGSHIGDLTLKFPNHQIYASFSFANKEEKNYRLNLSLRAGKGESVLDLARYYKGGGHTKAAGCRLTCTEENPYILITRKLNEFYTQGIK